MGQAFIAFLLLSLDVQIFLEDLVTQLVSLAHKLVKGLLPRHHCFEEHFLLGSLSFGLDKVLDYKAKSCAHDFINHLLALGHRLPSLLSVLAELVATVRLHPVFYFLP